MKRPNEDTRIALAMDIINWNAIEAYNQGEEGVGGLLRSAWIVLREAGCLLGADEGDFVWKVS